MRLRSLALMMILVSTAAADTLITTSGREVEREITVRVQDADAAPCVEVLQDQVSQERRLPRAGFAVDVRRAGGGPWETTRTSYSPPQASWEPNK